MVKNRFLCVALAAFVILSLVGLHRPQKKVEGPAAAELTLETTREGNEERSSYVNSYGVVTQPGDRDYTTIVKNRDENGTLVLEQYLDAEGKPARRSARYSAVSYAYEEGATRITYLDEAGNPTTITSGYASIYRTRNVDGRALRDTYFDIQGNPVRCIDGYHGVERVYDDQGRLTEYRYLDESGHPTNTASGYSRVVRVLDEAGRLEAVYYQDKTGNPIPKSTGEYGERYLWDEQGRAIQITYLDATGSPAPINAGYTIIQRSFDSNGGLYEEFYQDAAGNPVALSKGQYGRRYVNGIALQLNKHGHLMLSVDNLLDGYPYMVVLVGVLLCIAMTLLPARPRGALLAAYVLFIFYETLMFRESGDPRTALIPFTYLKRFWSVFEIRAEVINNVWLFVPLGAGIYCFCSRKKALWMPFFLTVGIELTQYLTGLGLAEADDVLGNSFGGVVGFLIAEQLRSLYMRHREKS